MDSSSPPSVPGVGFPRLIHSVQPHVMVCPPGHIEVGGGPVVVVVSVVVEGVLVVVG